MNTTAAIQHFFRKLFEPTRPESEAPLDLDFDPFEPEWLDRYLMHRDERRMRALGRRRGTSP